MLVQSPVFRLFSLYCLSICVSTECLLGAVAADESSFASVWSNDLDRCHRLAERIHCGIVWVNCWLQRDLRTPFGGVGHSGLGREGGLEVMRFFTEPKNVCIEHG